jgi:hypothetical protein
MWESKLGQFCLAIVGFPEHSTGCHNYREQKKKKRKKKFKVKVYSISDGQRSSTGKGKKTEYPLASLDTLWSDIGAAVNSVITTHVTLGGLKNLHGTLDRD